MSERPFAWAEEGAAVHHVGFLVEDLAPIAALFGDALGLEVSEPEELDDLCLRVLWVQFGTVAFEFLLPTSAEIPAAERLRQRGAGLDHVAVCVDSVAAALDWCRERGLPLLDQVPRPGAKGTTIAFIDPGAVAGTRVELVESPTTTSTG